MAYRLKKTPPPRPRRTVVDTATPVKLYVHNGSTGDFAFPCWYQEVHHPLPGVLHDKHWHDHIGWPSPRHPGHSCQLWIPEPGYCAPDLHYECATHAHHYVDMSRVIPIHLTSADEGYNSVSVAWVQQPQGITTTAWIDDDEDWIVRLNIACNDPNAKEEPQTYKLTVFVNAPASTGKPARHDIVVLAELTVLPSAY